jgi:hypothetical protein
MIDLHRFWNCRARPPVPSSSWQRQEWTMESWRSDPDYPHEDLAARASPEPRMPTDKERRQIAEAQERAKKDRAAMRAAGFGDHKGVEGS